jgi:hypothetical protein
MESVKAKHYLGDVGIDRRIILKWNLKKYGVRMWNGLIRFRTEISGELL